MAGATSKALAGTDVLTIAFVRVFRPAAASFGLARVTPHDLWHTAANLAAAFAARDAD